MTRCTKKPLIWKTGKTNKSPDSGGKIELRWKRNSVESWIKKCLIIVNVFRKLGNVYEKEIITEKNTLENLKYNT